MSDSSLLRSGWIRVKQYGPSALAAGLMYGGIYQIFEELRYPLGNCIVKLVNMVIRQSFPDRMLLPEFSLPWPYEVKVAGVGVIVVVLGIFIGLWAQARSPRQTAP